MIIVVLVVTGLCLGSFVNALVWRLHEQDSVPDSKATNKISDSRLSISRGRSMCPSCKHELSTKDLVPVFSWLSLGGKCRYCHKPISAQYPLVELATAVLFVASYVWWPVALSGIETVVFVLWLALVIGLMALLVYDTRWFLLPNKILYPLGVIAGLSTLITILSADNRLEALVNTVLAVVIGGGIFYILFQVSGGKWIGGGDVKLGWLLGLIVATPGMAFLMIFIATALGSIVSIPLLATGRLKRSSIIPFGPFLIAAAIIVVLFGTDILEWYQRTFLNIA